MPRKSECNCRWRWQFAHYSDSQFIACYRSQWLSNCRLIAQSAWQTLDFWHFDCCEFIAPLSLPLSLHLYLFLSSTWLAMFPYRGKCHTTVHTALAKRKTRLQFRCRSSCVFNCPNKCSSSSAFCFPAASSSLFRVQFVVFFELVSDLEDARRLSILPPPLATEIYCQHAARDLG